MRDCVSTMGGRPGTIQRVRSRRTQPDQHADVRLCWLEPQLEITVSGQDPGWCVYSQYLQSADATLLCAGTLVKFRVIDSGSPPQVADSSALRH